MSKGVNEKNALIQMMTNSKGPLLNIYCTAGYPSLESTSEIIKYLESAGVDMIEIGIPFSDPLADGPTIQASSMKALENGMTLKLLFQQIESIQTKVPIILMGYLNSVLQYGMVDFCESCQRASVSGVILPDLPFDLYTKEYQGLFEEYDICNINLITPRSSTERIEEIDQVTSGFIYAVSSSSTTGSKTKTETGDYLKRISEMPLRNPIMAGFNIRDKESFDQMTKCTRGGIIGSAFIDAISQGDNLEESVIQFIKSIKDDNSNK